MVISKYVFALVVAACSGSAVAQVYDLTEIGSLGGSDGSSTNWGSVNDSGDIAGFSYVSGNADYLAFVYSSGSLASLGTANNSQSYGINASAQVTGVTGGCGFVTVSGAVTLLNTLTGKCDSSATASSAGIAINSSGNVAGYSVTSSGDVHAVYFSGGKLKDLGTLGGANSYGYGLNDSGVVTGYSQNSSGENHAFITASGTLMDLGTLGGATSVGYAISASGLVTGTSQITGNSATHAFLYSNSEMHDLGGLGGTSGTGLAINSSGEVVGTATNSSGDPLAFIVTGGKLVNLNRLINPNDPLANLVTLTSATGISKSGYIVANGTDSRYAGTKEVFLLTPVEIKPTVTPVVTGQLGANGWYKSATTLKWTVTGEPPPTESGCGRVAVPNTKGTTYTCTATNAAGTAEDSITIKEDTVAPSVTITSPTQGETIPLNASVTAVYSCSDATSGVASCVGTVANGAKIPTSTSGTFTFTVLATDNAGLTASKSVTYTVSGSK